MKISEYEKILNPTMQDYVLGEKVGGGQVVSILIRF